MKHRKQNAPSDKPRANHRGQCLILIGLVVSAVIFCIVMFFLQLHGRNLTVLTVNGHKVSQAELQYYYIEGISDYLEKTSRYSDEDLPAIDFEKPLSEQPCPMLSNQSWHDYFLKSAIQKIGRDTADESEALVDDRIAAEAAAMRVGAIDLLAQEAGMSTEALLLEKYGNGVSLELIEDIENRAARRERLIGLQVEERVFSDEELEDYFQSKRIWNMLATYTAVPLDCDSSQYEDVLSDLAGVDNEEDFFARCTAYTEHNAVDCCVRYENVKATQMEDYTVAEWVLSTSRVPMETTVVRSYDETTYQEILIALQFHDSKRNDSPTWSYQEILLYPEMVHVGDTNRYLGGKNYYLFDLPAMELDRETFDIYSLAFSSLSSAEPFGWEQRSQEELGDTVYSQWLTSKERKPGELRVFETNYGAHVIRYIGEGSPAWQANAEAALREAYCAQLLDELDDAATQRASLLYSLLTSEKWLCIP